MAKLTTPHRAVGFKKGRVPEKRKMPAKGKYHLMKHDGDPCEAGFTACNLIVWGPNDFGSHEEAMFVGSRKDAYELPTISSIPAERICKKCLGPLKAED